MTTKVNGQLLATTQKSQPTASKKTTNEILIKRTLIDPLPGQPRSYFDPDEIMSLAVSIRLRGQLVPVLVRSLPNGRYQLVDGQRRWIACGDENVEFLKATILDIKDDKEHFFLSFVANLCRLGHTPLEIMNSIIRLKDDGYSSQEIADSCGYSLGWVNNHLALRKLHPKVHELMKPERPKDIRINFSVAIDLVPLEPAHQIKLAEHIVREKLPLTAARAYIRRQSEEQGLKTSGRGRKRAPHDDYRVLEAFLERIHRDTDNFLKMSFMTFEGMFIHRPAEDRRKMQTELTAVMGRLMLLRKRTLGTKKARDSRED